MSDKDESLPEGWETRVSKSRGATYYFAKATKKTQWDRPTEPAPQAEAKRKRDDDDAPDGEVQALHILAKHKDSRRPASWRMDPITRTKDEAIEIIKAHRADIVAGKKDFRAVAKTESDCSSAKRGGDLGPFTYGKMQKPFSAATFALKIDEVSDIVETDSGIHIIMRVEVKKK